MKAISQVVDMFERYVNFEFYKTRMHDGDIVIAFERYVNFEFYKTNELLNFKRIRLRDM